MLSVFKAQLAFPTGVYSKAAGTVNANLKGSSLNSGVYIVDPASLTGTLAGVAQFQTTVGITKRSPGVRGSNRRQVLTQAVVLDADGRPHVWSANTVLTDSNFFVPPTGSALMTKDVLEAVLATNFGYFLNPSDSATDTQDKVFDALAIGLVP